MAHRSLLSLPHAFRRRRISQYDHGELAFGAEPVLVSRCRLGQILFDGGLRSGVTAQARATYDANVATYSQTVLTGFQEVEDNLAALRILEEEAAVQAQAVEAARESVELTTNQYKAGIVSYLNVVAVQTVALNNERTAVGILGQRLTASVLLVKAIGGGWHAADLPKAASLRP